MIGISSYGGFVPRYRINRMTIVAAVGWFNPVTLGAASGEKAVANYDEDAITMNVAACIDCLRGRDRAKLDGLYAASTTFPYLERENAGIISAALDLKPAIRSADFRDSTKAGTGALLAAIDAVKSGEAKNILVGASDSRLGKAGSVQEHYYGDGAAALLVSDENVIAEFKGSYSMSCDFAEQVRVSSRTFARPWEERWIRDEGYLKIMPALAAGILAKTGMKITDFTKVIYPCLYPRAHKEIAKKLGLEKGQVADPFHQNVGDVGAAHPLFMLSAALQTAKPGDKILVIGYGNGGDAIAFEVTPAIAKFSGPRGVSGYLAIREDLTHYEKYTIFRDLVPMELGIRGEFEAPTAFSTLWRSHREVMGLVGTKCKACGTAQFPAQRICVNPDCGAVDQMDPYGFSEKKGTIFAYTGDNLAFSISPPAIYGSVEMEGGGKLFLDFTDCTLEAVQVGMPMELSFRRKYIDRERGIHGYFWKALPAKD